MNQKLKFNLKNLLILLAYIFIFGNDLNGQTRCSSLESDQVFITTEIMPKPIISMNEMEKILNQNLNINEFELPASNKIYLSFIINCKGEPLEYKSFRPINQKLEVAVIKTFKEYLKWKPAMQNSRSVDIQLTIEIATKKNKFTILNKKEINNK